MQYQVRNNWRGLEDSNLRMAESKSAALLNFPVRDRLFKLVPARMIGFEALRGNKHVQIKGNGVFPDCGGEGAAKNY
jgi:hypothetical protein